MLKLDGTVNKSEESIVGTDTDVVAGMNLGSSLSDDYIAGEDRLTVGFLDAKSF